MARPSENRWETHHYREASKKRSLHEVEINNRYIYDPDATFPDDAICGERATRARDNRHIYGDVVKVCNTRPDPAAAGANPDDYSPPALPTARPPKPRHVNCRSIYWPDSHPEDYSRCSAGIHARPQPAYIRPKAGDSSARAWSSNGLMHRMWRLLGARTPA